MFDHHPLILAVLTFRSFFPTLKQTKVNNSLCSILCWALLRKYFCNCYWPFDGPLIIEMQEFTWVGWIEKLYACAGTVKCHLLVVI